MAPTPLGSETPDLHAAFERIFGPTDWSRGAAVVEGPTSDPDPWADDSGLQARADSRTTDIFGGTR